MRVSCCVVAYENSPEQIDRVFESIVCAGVRDLALYLVDNSPADRLSAVARRYGAEYIPLPVNPGFGAAHNVAMADALGKGSRYHLVVNPDVHFGADVLPALLDHMERHPDIGLLMPDIRYPDGRRQHLCKLLPHPVDLLARRFFPWLYRASGRLGRYEMHDSGYDRVMDVPALSGCFMLLRASVLRETGGFDERFFLYLEDVDLSRRIGRLARTVYYPHVSVTHDYGQGSYKNGKLLYCHIRSAILYFNKWGWFSDPEKETINNAALRKIQANHHG